MDAFADTGLLVSVCEGVELQKKARRNSAFSNISHHMKVYYLEICHWIRTIAVDYVEYHMTPLHMSQKPSAQPDAQMSSLGQCDQIQIVVIHTFN